MEIVSTRIRCTIRSWVLSGVQHSIYVSGVYHSTYRYVIREHSQFIVHYEQFIIINYISEHQLSHAIDASHTTPTSRVNRGSMLLKLIG